MNEFLTWSFLATFAGAVAAVTLIVQFLKLPADKVWKIPTRYLVFIISAIVLFTVMYFTDVITPEKVALTLLNSIVVTMAALGTYDVTFKKVEDSKNAQKGRPPG